MDNFDLKKYLAEGRLLKEDFEDFPNQKYYDLLNDLRDEGLLNKLGISSLQSEFNLSREKAKEIFDEYLEDLKAEQPDAFDFFMKDLNEGDTYEKMAAKGKKAGNLKQGTVRKRLRIKDGEKIPLARINKAISGLKKRKSLSDKDKKYLKALNLAKTLKTTTNVKEIATELGYLNEQDRFAGFADKPANKKDYLGKGLDKLKRSIKKPVSNDPELNKSKSKVDITYTDPGDRFYKMKVDGKRLDREEGTKYLKDLGIVDDKGKDMEIPRSYNQSTLKQIVDKLKEKGIDADYNNAFDPS